MLFKHPPATKEIIKWALSGAAAEVIYVFLVAALINGLNRYMPTMPQAIGVAFMLLLLVLSVGLSGIFIFGYPAFLALQKSYKEAAWAVGATFLFLFLGLVIIFLAGAALFPHRGF